MKPSCLPPDLADPALADACRSGDRRAQHALWERYKDRMFGVCLRYAASRQEAEDLLQEAFVQVFHNIGQYRGEGSLEGWIRRITVRTALRALKKQRFDARQFDEAEWALQAEAAEPLLPAAGEEPELLISLLQKLPPGFRAVINLYILEERTHEEIAAELGISVGTSKSQLHRAKAFLRQLTEKTHVTL
jgi:RNA polymerase sigma-70 factor (ECF subfamily)